ncbi:MAG TPA: septal ring lytic transglycosylase RlpA family protein [Solirubrobacteraceae bacterium]|nr:septal ring lytic transglycosylase RlpA family protein [Solirubrobacteraceae bacterium]
MTKSRRSRLGGGALMIGIPASVAALVVAGQALAAPTPAPPQIHPQSRHIAYGHNVVIRGAAPAADAGHTVVLEFARPGDTVWSQLASTTVGSTGAFRLAGRLEQSGNVRVVDTSSGSLTPFLASASADSTLVTSNPVPVDVAARVRMSQRAVDVLAGQAVLVRGRLLPAVKGRKVALQALQNRSWHTLATARTKSGGRFVLRYVAGSAGREPIRVRFAGDRLNGRSTARAGQITAFRTAEASWYNDGGNTACGFHAGNGVANRTLPCGTKVVFRYGGRTVTATVDDRGPFVGGRDWDLNQNTAAALGFGGVGQVWSSQ